MRGLGAVLLLVLIGCGGPSPGPEGADCSAWVTATQGYETCRDTANQWQCYPLNATGGGVWHVRHCPNACSNSDGFY